MQCVWTTALRFGRWQGGDFGSFVTVASWYALIFSRIVKNKKCGKPVLVESIPESALTTLTLNPAVTTHMPQSHKATKPQHHNTTTPQHHNTTTPQHKNYNTTPQKLQTATIIITTHHPTFEHNTITAKKTVHKIDHNCVFRSFRSSSFFQSCSLVKTGRQFIRLVIPNGCAYPFFGITIFTAKNNITLHRP